MCEHMNDVLVHVCMCVHVPVCMCMLGAGVLVESASPSQGPITSILQEQLGPGGWVCRPAGSCQRAWEREH